MENFSSNLYMVANVLMGAFACVCVHIYVFILVSIYVLVAFVWMIILNIGFPHLEQLLLVSMVLGKWNNLVPQIYETRRLLHNHLRANRVHVYVYTNTHTRSLIYTFS